MVIPTIHFRSEYSSIPLRIAKGHFATSHSHLNYYIDMTYTKHRLAEAKQAAKELAIQYHKTDCVDTILCLDGTEVLGACLADALTELGVRNKNEHDTIPKKKKRKGKGEILLEEWERGSSTPEPPPPNFQNPTTNPIVCPW